MCKIAVKMENYFNSSVICMCNRWYNIIPDQKVEFPVHGKLHCLELPMDWKFRLFCQTAAQVSRTYSKVMFSRSCSCSKSDKIASTKTFVGECERWFKVSLNCFGGVCWNPVDMDLRKSAWWACSRATYPARLKSTDWGLQVMTWKAVPELRLSLSDVKAEIFF